MLNRVVLNPLAVITSEAEAIGTRSYLSARLNLERDEIGALAREFGRMFGSVAESRAQLRDQLFQTVRAEVAISVLHNVGNILNSVNISASLVAERVKQSRISGVRLR
jgi:two-component system, NtrC family, sensor kinase